MQGKLLFKQSIYIAILLVIVSCNTNKTVNSDDTKAIAKAEESIAIPQADDPIIMTLWIYGGNHHYDLIIGSDSAKVNNTYNSMSPDMEELDKSWDIHKHILSQNAIGHIWKYVQDNCTPAKGKLAGGEHFFYIWRPIDFEKIDNNACCVESKELGIKYFTGLIKWIESSPYKNECKYLVGDIQAKFIEGKAFPLTPYQQRLLDR